MAVGLQVAGTFQTHPWKAKNIFLLTTILQTAVVPRVAMRGGGTSLLRRLAHSILFLADQLLEVRVLDKHHERELTLTVVLPVVLQAFVRQHLADSDVAS